MRVLIVTNLFRPVTLGGYERGCAEFADALALAGDEVCILTTDLTDDPPGVLDPQGLEVHRVLRSYRRLDGSMYGGSVRYRLGVERRNVSALRNLARRFRPDVVMYWNLGGLSVSLIEEGRRLGVPACGIVNDYWMDWGPRVDAWQRLKHRVRGVGWAGELLLGVPARVRWAQAAHWVFVSDHVRARTIEAVGPLPRTSIVHSGIDLDAFTAGGSRPPWSRRFLFVGRVTKNKGIDIAIDAVAAVPGATLTICGPRDVSFDAELEAYIARLGLVDRVTFVERSGAAEVAGEYATHDAVLFPARWAEPWGKVPLEAMATGVPVITSATGGSAEYCDDAQNCLVAATAEEFAAAMLALEADPSLRDRLRAGGIRTAGRFGIEQANAGRLAIVRALASEQAPAVAADGRSASDGDDPGGRAVGVVNLADSTGNPYLDSMVAALGKEQVRVLPMRLTPRSIWAARRRGIRAVHVHWPEYLVNRGAGRAAIARQLISFWRFAAAVGLGRLLGIRLVWTVHNLGPHDPAAPWVRRLPYRVIAAAADVFVTHSAAAGRTAAARYRRAGRADRRVVAPHGNYSGAYGAPPADGGAAVREQYGIPHDATLLLAFGQVRSYKRLAELAALVGHDPFCHLVIAGAPVDGAHAAEVEGVAQGFANVHLDLRRIPDHEVAALYGAADLAVLHYAEVFSSGALLLALSEGVAAVLPRSEAAAEVAGWPAVAMYDGDDLRGAVQSILLEPEPERRAAALAAARNASWSTTARRLVEAYFG